MMVRNSSKVTVPLPVVSICRIMLCTCSGVGLNPTDLIHTSSLCGSMLSTGTYRYKKVVPASWLMRRKTSRASSTAVCSCAALRADFDPKLSALPAGEDAIAVFEIIFQDLNSASLLGRCAQTSLSPIKRENIATSYDSGIIRRVGTYPAQFFAPHLHSSFDFPIDLSSPFAPIVVP